MKSFRSTIPASVLFHLALGGLLVVCGCSEPEVPERTHSTTPAALPKNNTATLTASPNPVPANSKSTTITWSVGSATTGEVYVSEDGGPEKLFAQDRKGSKAADWIVKQRYEVRLYAGKDHKTLLASVVVTREPASAQFSEKK